MVADEVTPVGQGPAMKGDAAQAEIFPWSAARPTQLAQSDNHQLPALGVERDELPVSHAGVDGPTA